MSFSGTSASTAHVTGAAALYKSEHPGESPSDIMMHLGALDPQQIQNVMVMVMVTLKEIPDNNTEPLLYTASNSSRLDN